MSALSQALPLALAAAVYPPAMLVVILLLTGEHPRRLVYSYLAGAAVIVGGVGVAGLFLVTGTGATPQDSNSGSAGVDLAIGIALLALAAWAWRRRLRPPKEPDEPAEESRLTRVSHRATASAGWAFVLGILMYLPSPLYLAAIKAIADSGDSTQSQLLAIAICAICLMIFVEVPAVILAVRPDGLRATLERFTGWLSTNGWALLAVLAGAAGIWLSLRAILELT